MILIEKMLFLKTLPLFKYTPDEVLLTVASIVEEEVVEPETVIIEKGSFGTTMYMIVEGKVKVHDNDHFLKQLGEREVFGELSALSPEKRNASVTALEETFLFKLKHNALHDLMQVQTGLAIGIIEVLCQRVRTIVSETSKKS